MDQFNLLMIVWFILFCYCPICFKKLSLKLVDNYSKLSSCYDYKLKIESKSLSHSHDYLKSCLDNHHKTIAHDYVEKNEIIHYSLGLGLKIYQIILFYRLCQSVKINDFISFIFHNYQEIELFQLKLIFSQP